MKSQLITLIAACALAAGAASAEGWKTGTKLPDLKSYGLIGTVPDTKGKVVYLDFWASWCAPCKASFPTLEKWNKDYSKRGFTVIGVSVDEKEAAMTDFLKKTPVAFPVLRDAQQKLVVAANVPTMPTSFLIDRKGNVRLVHTGFRSKDASELASKIEELLNEK